MADRAGVPATWYAAALRQLGAHLSQRGGLQRLCVLYYHRVLAEPDPLHPDLPDRHQFTVQMQALADMFRVLPLAEAVSALGAGSLPPRAVAVSFDDGYADNYHVALPILRRLGLPATFFVTPAYLDGGLMFNDQVLEACRSLPAGVVETGLPELGALEVGPPAGRRRLAEHIIGRLKYLVPERRRDCAARLLELSAAKPGSLMMSSAEVAALARADMSIGGHTLSHPILATLSTAAAREEIGRGRSRLAEITGRPVTLFAYPNGKPGRDYGPRDVELVREAGFAAAFSTVWGCGDRRWDVHQLPRIAPWDRSRFRFALRVLKSYRDPAPVAAAPGLTADGGVPA